MSFYKFLAPGTRSRFTGYEWPAPNGGAGAWVEAVAPLEECVSGVHVCRARDLPLWLDAELWEIETEGETIAEERQVLVERARLLRWLDAWTEEAARELGLACMRRAKAAAAEALRDAGFASEAERLERADEPDDVRRTGHAASAIAEQAGSRVVSRVAYAAGTAGYHMAVAPPSSPSYVAYAAFSAYAATVVADTLEPGGYDAERARQAAWLGERLGVA